MISRIDHISLAVNDYEKARRFFTEILGAVSGTAAEDDQMKYFWNIFSIGDLSRIELIAPTGEGSFLDNFLKDKKDGGVHHITMETPDIYQAKKHLDENGIPYFGFKEYGNAWKEFFIHPKDAFGILIQIAEMNPNDYLGESVKFTSGQRWAVQANEKGGTLTFAHPGGGKAALEMTKTEIKELIRGLENIS